MLFKTIGILLLATSASLAGDPIDFEIITMFQKNVVEMPEQDTIAAISDVDFSNYAIKDFLIDMGAEYVIKAFPNYDPSDTLREVPRCQGHYIYMTRLDRVFKIRFKDNKVRDQVNIDLENFEEVVFHIIIIE